MGKHSQKNRTNKHPPLASTAKPRKNYRAFILPAILLIAFVIRVSLIPSAEKMPFNYMSDSRMYADKAMLILDGKETEAVSHQGPLYPYFIAGICAIAGRSSMRPVLVVQMLLALCAIFLVYSIALRFTNSWPTACLAAFLLALYQPMIFYEQMILMESLLAFLYLIIIWLLLKAQAEGKKWLWFASGALIGIAALGRGTVLLFALLLIIATVLKSTPLPWPEKKSLYVRLLVFTLGIMAALSPLTIRNYSHGKEFVPLAANFGITFYEGNNRFSKGMYMDPPGLNINQDFTGEKIAAYLAGRPLKPSEVSRFWTGEAWRDIKGDPMLFVKLLGLKAAYYCNAAEIPNAESYAYASTYASFYSIPLFGFPIAGIFGAIGIAFALQKRRKGHATLLLFMAAHAVSVVMFFVTARYRISVVPIVLIFASMAIVRIYDLYKEKRSGMLAILGLAGIGAGLGVFFPWPRLDGHRFLASTHTNLGFYFAQNQNADAARQYYETAIKECPVFWKSYNNLGNLYSAEGEKENALKCYFQGLKKGLPDDSCAMFIHMSLGVFYLKEGTIDEARKNFAIASPFVPYSLMVRQVGKELKF
jgi:4-amino-4-deoxy-L-arabinose transferase-like glycosyltransferase